MTIGKDVDKFKACMTLLCNKIAGMECCMMFNRGTDDSGTAQFLYCSENGGIAAFSSSTGKKYFRWMGMKYCCH